jgi:ATP-dependent Clp protease ATP-binding subunit ClpX
MKPVEIYEQIKQDVVGQDEVLRFISVAIFKHIMGDKFGNLLLIGNSGTGKTSVMLAIERMYNELAFFERNRVVVRMNANTFADEEGRMLPFSDLFHRLELRALSILGDRATPELVREYVEHATVCIDEVDKITAKIGGKPNITGINLQQGMLTLMEGEQFVYETELYIGGEYQKCSFTIDTGYMLFICGGAFEELYDQVYSRVFKEGKHDRLTRMVMGKDGNVTSKAVFTLKDNLEQVDLFNYGMLPQFMSRLDNAIVLKDLTPYDLKVIFMETANCIFKQSQEFFAKLNVDLRITDEAALLVTGKAAEHSRIGARALKDIYGRIIKRFEFDPYSAEEIKKVGDRYELTLDESVIKRALGMK